MKKILILLLLLACKEPDNLCQMFKSDALPLQWTPVGESSFNTEQLGYIDQSYCFHQKRLCSAQLYDQGYDTEYRELWLKGYDEDDTLLYEGLYNISSYQLFAPLSEWDQFGSDASWNVGSSQIEVTLGSGAVDSNRLRTFIVPPEATQLRVKYDVDNSATSCSLVFRFRDTGSAVTPLPAAITLAVGENVGYFDITLDAPADDFTLEIQKASGAGTIVSVNSVKLYRTSKVDDTFIYNTSLIPSDESMCDKFVDFKIFASQLGVSFGTSLYPATNEGTEVESWSWDTGKAKVTVPGLSVFSKRLRMPFNSISGESYSFEVDATILIGGGSAGNATRIIAYLTDGITFTDDFEITNLPLGANQILTFPITATSDWPYVEFVVQAANALSFDREVYFDYIRTPLVELFYTDSIEFVSVWANSSHEGRVVIEYAGNQNTDDGLIYDDNSPTYFNLEFDGQFAQPEFETVENEIKLTGTSLNTASSMQEKTKLIINDGPRYLHRKIILALQHAAVGSVLVNGEEISLGAGYTLGTDRPATYPQRPAEIVLNLKYSYKHNVL